MEFLLYVIILKANQTHVECVCVWGGGGGGGGEGGWSVLAKVSCILPGRLTDIGLQLGKACYTCSR